MMKTRLPAILFFSTFFFCQAAWGQTNREIAQEKARDAVMLMESGQIDSSIVLLEEAWKLDPTSFGYPYEIGYALYLKQDYKGAVKILEKCRKYQDANDLLYQLLGNAYDMSGQRKKALKIYDAGLKIFPNSGRLYLEKGVVYDHSGNKNKGFESFITGIKVDPLHSSNYYWACQYCLSSPNKVWGMIYGEMFLNLEINTKRSSYISRLLYGAYVDQIMIEGDSVVSVDFIKTMVLPNNPADFQMPFEAVYEVAMLASVSGAKQIDPESLNTIRSNFVETFFENGYNLKYPVTLFDYQKKIRDAGHMEAYNHWILTQGDPEILEKWENSNPEKWRNFVKWFKANRLSDAF